MATTKTKETEFVETIRDIANEWDRKPVGSISQSEELLTWRIGDALTELDSGDRS